MSLTPQSKNSVTLNPIRKAGTGWYYDQVGITYDGEYDAEGRKVLYDSIGTAATLTPLSKNSVTLTGLTKNTA